MRPSKIKAKLGRGEPVLVTTIHSTDPSGYELVSLMGFDGLWMDLEHHAASVETAGHLMQRCPSLDGYEVLHGRASFAVSVTITGKKTELVFESYLGDVIEWRLADGKPFAIIVETADDVHFDPGGEMVIAK